MLLPDPLACLGCPEILRMSASWRFSCQTHSLSYHQVTYVSQCKIIQQYSIKAKYYFSTQMFYSALDFSITNYNSM
jgi:hypothetical protein